MTNRLLNKVAIITGGSKGIGKGITKLYAAQGAKVVLNYASDNNNSDASLIARRETLDDIVRMECDEAL